MIPPPLPAWCPPGTVVERSLAGWKAVKISTVPEFKRDRWGTDSDQILAVFENGVWRKL